MANTIDQNLFKVVKDWRDQGLVKVGGEALENVSGRVLHQRTGNLYRDVQSNQQTETPSSFSIGTSLVYGKAWEKGFRRRAFTVRPVRAKALRIPISSSEFIFRLRADIPAGEFAARSFLAPAVETSRAWLVKTLGNLIRTATDTGKLFQHREVVINLKR